MEDSSIVQVQQLQILYRRRYSMYLRHNACSAIVERSRCSWTSATRRRSLARYDGEIPDSDRWTCVAALESTLWRIGSQCSWRSTGVMYERRVPVTRRAAAFWTDCNRGTSVLLTCGRTESCSSPGDWRQTPGPMFYLHLQTMTGQLAVAGAAGSRHFDRPQRREPNVTVGHPIDGPLEPSYRPISNGFRDIQRRIWRDGWHDLKRPLNKGHGHFISFVLVTILTYVFL